MPTAVPVSIATAVTAALAAAALSQTPATVERSYGDWEFDLALAEASGLRIDVMCNEQKTSLGSRRTFEHGIPVLICVRQKLGRESQNDDDGRIDNSAVDALMYLVEEIAELFAMTRLEDVPSAVWQESKVLQAPVPAHLAVHRQFTGMIQVTFKADKEIA